MAGSQMPGVVVAIAEEDDEVESRRRRFHVLQQRRARRSLAVEPADFVGERVRLLEDLEPSIGESGASLRGLRLIQVLES